MKLVIDIDDITYNTLSNIVTHYEVEDTISKVVRAVVDGININKHKTFNEKEKEYNRGYINGYNEALDELKIHLQCKHKKMYDSYANYYDESPLER